MVLLLSASTSRRKVGCCYQLLNLVDNFWSCLVPAIHTLPPAVASCAAFSLSYQYIRLSVTVVTSDLIALSLHGQITELFDILIALIICNCIVQCSLDILCKSHDNTSEICSRTAIFSYAHGCYIPCHSRVHDNRLLPSRFYYRVCHESLETQLWHHSHNNLENRLKTPSLLFSVASLDFLVVFDKVSKIVSVSIIAQVVPF